VTGWYPVARMRHRALRFTLVGVLLATGAAAGMFVRQQVTGARTAETAHEEVIARLDHISSLLRGMADEELRSVALGVSERTGTSIADLVKTVEAEAGVLGQRARSDGASARLASLVDSAHLLAAVDGRARDNVRVGQTLMATDLILTEGRGAAAAIEGTLSALRLAEIRTAARARRAVDDGLWVTLAGVGALWVLGLLWLAAPAEARQERAAVETMPPSMPAPPAEAPTTVPPPALDIEHVATVCGDIARTCTTSGLSDALERAAGVLHAPGLIIWMASGDELFAALGVGYDQRIMARLGPIPRDAANATAAAWRTGDLQTVTGDIASRGAVVAPMSGPDGCLGVLAAEIPHGREHEPLTRAAVAMIAAQLVSVMSAWPSASRPASDDTTQAEPIADADERLQA